jgi:xanthine dehydrogenase accessory factor
MKMDSETIHRRIADLLKKRKTFAIATIVETKGSCPQASGARMIVHPDASIEFTIGGGTFEAEVIQDALSILARNSSETRQYRLTKSDLGMYCQGLVRVMFEPYLPSPRMLILGGGHVGQALSRIAAASGLFSVVVVDDRIEYANREKHPEADKVIHTDRDFKKRIPAIDCETYVVIVTRCHATDKEIIKSLVGQQAAYIGLIGSKPKIKQFHHELAQEGVPVPFLESIYAPIGIPIGGKQPSEVAVSILAEVIRVKNERRESRTVTFQNTLMK